MTASKDYSHAEFISASRPRNKFRMTLALLFFSLLSSLPLQAADLNITSWGGEYQSAQRDVFFKPFTADSGKKVTEKVYDGGLDEIQTLIKSEKQDWDVVEVDAADLIRGCQKKYFEVLNWHKVGQRSEFMTGTHHNCGVGSVIWAMVLAYNDKTFPDDKPNDWKDFWDIKKFPGKRALRKTAKTTLEIALLAAGVNRSNLYDTLRDPRGVDKAFEKLDKLYPHIIWWEAGDQPGRLLATKNAAMVAAYNGRIADSIDRGATYRMVWQDALYSVDFWAIMKNAPNKDAAYQYLRFITQPKAQAELAERIPYAPTMKRAYKIMGRQKSAYMPDIKTKGKFMLAIDNHFWALAEDKLEAKFQKWLKSTKNK